MKIDSQYTESFETRHIGPDSAQTESMLKIIGTESVNELIDQTIPSNIRLKSPLNLPRPRSEYEFLQDFRKLASRNKVYKTYVGMGYYNTVTPGVIRRNILENPGWYTAYTPYQAEIAQGRLEALINYQTMIIDLTGMQIANASLLDEATAAAEAMHLFLAFRKGQKKNALKFFVDKNTYPQTIDVLRNRSTPLEVNVVVGDSSTLDLTDPELFAIYLQNPDNNGAIKDYTSFIRLAHENDVYVVMGTDLMSLLLMNTPGEMGADVAVGTSQRFGVPMGFGGPHAAFFATKEEFKRQVPGRIIGASIDAHGNPGYRMALQTREQHIRREKATSNICTAQVLLSVMAGMFAVYHGPQGLKKIAGRIHGLTKGLDQVVRSMGLKQVNENYFDTLKVEVPDKKMIEHEALKHNFNFRYFSDNHVGISLDETTSPENVNTIIGIFAAAQNKAVEHVYFNGKEMNWPQERKSVV